MDHKLAETTELADRYLLNEISGEERTEFEAHFFECPICSEKVRTGAIFIDNARAVLRGEKVDDLSRSREWSLRWKWFPRLNLAMLAPSLAALALACIVGYQNLVTIPAFERPQLLSTAVIAPLAREEAAVVKVDRHTARFNLNFMVDS
ncbi:MAG: zf-HC2 domain-containing protein, partial [Bryobacteraceae bacterium]